MTRLIAFFLFILAAQSSVVAGPAGAAAASVGADDTTRTDRQNAVSYLSGKDTVSAYLAIPEGDGPFPALIVIHEWWGLTDWIRENARRFASEGYAALAIDLYRGRSATTSDDAHQLSRGLPEDRAGRDLAAAYDFLKRHPRVDSGRIGAIGWCMGGGYSLEAAATLPGLRAAVICYGRLLTDSTRIKGINASILGIFGGTDRGIPAESVREFERSSRALGKSVDVRMYDQAGHAFMNPGNSGGYRKADADDAWKRISEHLNAAVKARK